ncbi:hypothetical protein G184_gp24 [Erwinia phage ENT90]|uniref:Uncharacterized protein n=1 Tax=Erwinia phage ENT90 TaxID=947843 RepID=F1BUT3_9CAUD|nr:hypothetical protein G184_gp24 [Erwinia phage ENT90]ADX32439.1 hypothetical protein [Erwinia phage ENT90]
MLRRVRLLFFGFALQLYLFRLRVFGVQPAGDHAGIGTAIGNAEAVPVAVLAGQGQLRDRFAADGNPGTGPDKQQTSCLDGRHRAMQRGQPRQKFGVCLLRLVDMAHRNACEFSRHSRGQLVASGYLFQHSAQGGVMPGCFTA